MIAITWFFMGMSISFVIGVVLGYGVDKIVQESENLTELQYRKLVNAINDDVTILGEEKTLLLRQLNLYKTDVTMQVGALHEKLQQLVHHVK